MKTNKKLFGFIVSTLVTGLICNNVSATPISSDNAHQNHSVASGSANNNVAIDSNFLTISQIDDFANPAETLVSWYKPPAKYRNMTCTNNST